MPLWTGNSRQPLLTCTDACCSAGKVQECTPDNSSATYTLGVQSQITNRSRWLRHGLTSQCCGWSPLFIRWTSIPHTFFQIKSSSSVNDLKQRQPASPVWNISFWFAAKLKIRISCSWSAGWFLFDWLSNQSEVCNMATISQQVQSWLLVALDTLLLLAQVLLLPISWFPF